MNDIEEKLGKLENLPSEYEPNPEVAKRAIAQLKAREQVKKTKSKRFWKIFAPVALCLVTLFAVGLPLYLTNFPVEPKYFDEMQIESEIVDDLSILCQQNKLNVKYFESKNDIVKKYCITENKKLAYVNQTLSFNFDTVSLNIIVLQNATFSFEKYYDALDYSSTVINGTKVYYNDVYYEEEFNHIVKAKFNYGGHKYYLEITTCDTPIDALENYVNELLRT